MKKDDFRDLVNPHILKLSPYIPGKPIEEVQREFGLEEIYKLASNESCVGTSSRAIQRLIEYASQLYLYPDSTCYYLRQALAKRHKVGMDSILVSNGAVEALYFLAVALLGPQDEVIAGEVSFAMYPVVAQMMNATLVRTPMKDFRLDLKAMARAVTERTKIIFIDNPNNPAGTIVTRQEVEALMETIPPRVLVVFDEAYLEFVESPDFPDTLSYLEDGRRVAIVRTFSKNYGLAGLRVGYMMAPSALIEILGRVQPPFNVNSAAQAAALAALEDDSHLKTTVKVTQKEKRFLYEGFERLHLFYVPSESNFILVNTGINAIEFFQRLLREGIIVRPAGPALPTFVRISVGTHEANHKLLESIEKVLAGAME